MIFFKFCRNLAGSLTNYLDSTHYGILQYFILFKSLKIDSLSIFHNLVAG